MDDDEHNRMDVDTPTEPLFSASDKTKRSAANLPIEAQDTLPWVEKYRPNSLNDVSGHHDILATINKFVDTNRLPHLLLYGPPGTGKTSTILALARKIYGPVNVKQMVLELNASDDRGIDVVREQIKTFSSTRQIFALKPGWSKQTGSGGDSTQSAFKLIILDEADAMTSTAQMALRRIMEKYTANTRFCIIANYTHKLSPALLSRCTRFRFSPLKEADIRRLVDRVIVEENVQITPDAIDSLVKLSRGDMRRALNVLQACHASSTPLPADVPAGADRPQNETITQETVYNCIAVPQPHHINTILSTLLQEADFSSCMATIQALKTQNGLALADIISSLTQEILTLDVPVQTRITWLSGLADLEYRISAGANETVQTGGLIGVIREGVETMGKA